MGIKVPGFELGSMHFGDIGAANDVDSPVVDGDMKDLVLNAPVSEENTTSNGGEGPRSA